MNPHAHQKEPGKVRAHMEIIVIREAKSFAGSTEGSDVSMDEKERPELHEIE